MVDPPTVSVMMPAFNMQAHIATAIESLRAQTYSDWELVVVDDGSTDGTRSIASRYDDGRVRVAHRTNGGEGAARNTALDLLHGKYIAFLDADDAFLTDHLETTVAALQGSPDAVGVYTDGYHIDRNGRRLSTLSSRRRTPVSGHVLPEVMRGSDLICPPVSIVLRAEPVRRRRLRFDEDLVIGTDWVFLAKVAHSGPFQYIDQTTCLYRVHAGSLSTHPDLRHRARQLAACRLRMTNMPGFATCSVEVQVAVFYELLVNLLRFRPDEQAVVVESEPFRALPISDQARLLRLMASKAILHGGTPETISTWLWRSRRLRAADPRVVGLSALYRASPRLCRSVLRLRTGHEVDPLTVPPFADLYIDGL